MHPDVASRTGAAKGPLDWHRWARVRVAIGSSVGIGGSGVSGEWLGRAICGIAHRGCMGGVTPGDGAECGRATPGDVVRRVVM